MNKLINEKIKKYNLENKRIVLAVSGGVDSVVLLDLLIHSLTSKNIIVAHFNHGVRSESDADERFVGLLSKKRNLKFCSKKIKPKKKSEAYLRKERYDWLYRIAEKEKADYILTAHHGDDQLETVILNLTRGSGPLEIWGMEEISGKVLRPLLSASKKEIKSYAKKKRLTYREDKTNKELLYARNRIREKVIPEIEQINPSIRKTISHNLLLATQLRIYIKSEVDKLEKIAREGNRLNITVLMDAPRFLVQELIKKMVFKSISRKNDVYYKNIEEITGLIEKKGTKKTRFAGVEIIKAYDWLIFDNKGPENVEDSKYKIRDTLIIGKAVEFNGFYFMTKIGNQLATVNNILLSPKFSDKLEVRVWQKGDKIKTTSGTKKLQDIFVDAKIPEEKRKKWPVITCIDEVVWVPKLAASHHAKKRNTNLIIEVK